MPRPARFLIDLVLVIALACSQGCAMNRKPMDAAAAPRIHTLALLDVSTPKDVQYTDPSGAFMAGMVGGDIGAIAAEIGMAVPQSELHKALPDSAYPGRLLTEELQAALQRKGFTVRRIPDGPPSHRPANPSNGSMNEDMFVKDYSKLPAADADALLDAVCVAFGYERFNLSTSDHPMISIGVRLTTPNGKTVYYVQGLTFTQDGSPHESQYVNINADPHQFTATWPDLFKDPKRLDDQLHIAARALCDAIAHDIAAEK